MAATELAELKKQLSEHE
jgi:hypothetical protein